MQQRTRPNLFRLTIEAMLAHVRAATVGGMPRFRLPPRDVHVLACIDQLPGICGDERARALCAELAAIGVRIGGAGGEPTLRMLDQVLDAAGVPVERVALEDLVEPHRKILFDATALGRARA